MGVKGDLDPGVMDFATDAARQALATFFPPTKHTACENLLIKNRDTEGAAFP